MDEVVILGSYGLNKASIHHDITRLFTEYFAGGVYAFGAFKRVWDAMQFGLFQFACTEKAGRSSFMQAFYQGVLGYLYKNNRVEMRVGVLYALYLLYCTQPECFEPVYIRMTPDQTRIVQATLQECQQMNCYLDCMYVMRQLLMKQAILFARNEYRQVMSGVTEHQDDVGIDVMLLKMEKTIYGRDVIPLLDTRVAQVDHVYRETRNGSGIHMATPHTGRDMVEMEQSIQHIQSDMRERQQGTLGYEWTW